MYLNAMIYLTVKRNAQNKAN